MVATNNTASNKNVDPQEISKFEVIANSWWDPEGKFKPLHDLNPLRTKFIIEQASQKLKGANILDVGCGGGILTEALAKAGAMLTGIDLSRSAIHEAKLHAEAKKLTIAYQCIDIEEFLEEHAGQFDVVTCLELLEHVPDPARLIQACAKLVKPGGDVFFSTLNRHPKAFLLGVVAAEYILRLLPRGTHDYSKFIRPAELDTWAREAKLTCHTIKGITYNPLTRVAQLSDRLEINYMAHYTRGLSSKI